MVDNKQQWKAWLFLLPAIVLLLIFTVWPIINTVIMSFNVSEAEDGFKFGFGNFAKVFKNQGNVFGEALKNTFFLCLLTVPISTFLALLIAVALNAIKPLQRLFQTIFFLPYVTNTIAIGMVFAVMFKAQGTTHGVINDMIVGVCSWFGKEVDPVNWMNANSSYGANLFVVSVYIIWNALPFKILVLLGGLQGINKQYYDAAKVDGTSKIRVFWRVTVPLLSPMLAYVIITGFIGGFKEYNSVLGIFGEKMGNGAQQGAGSMQTVVGMIYGLLDGENYGFASAVALVLFAIILAITMVNLYVSKKRVHY